MDDELFCFWLSVLVSIVTMWMAFFIIYDVV